MSGILFLVFSGQASAIFDNFLLNNHKKYIAQKKKVVSGSAELNNNGDIFIIETQWDDGGHTGVMLDFNLWLEENREFYDLTGTELIMPPPLGDLKSQISRWSKHLVSGDFSNTISSLINNRHKSIDFALLELSNLLEILENLSPDIFIAEEQMHFSRLYFKLYKEFTRHRDLEINHSVGNLFLHFLYIYSYLLTSNTETIYEHHHQAFFNFLKDLNLIPRGVRFEFLIDGRYNLSGVSKDGILISSERFFDDYPSSLPVELESYTLKPIDGSDIDNKFEQLIENSNIVIIPPGSLSNWMPLINKFSKNLVNKPILWFLNSFTHNSEADIDECVNYFYSIGLNPSLILPKLSNPFDELNADERNYYEKSYSDQGKKPVNFDSLSRLSKGNLFKILPLKELEPGEGGIKYNPIFVDQVISNVYANIHRTDRELTPEGLNDFLRKTYGL